MRKTYSDIKEINDLTNNFQSSVLSQKNNQIEVILKVEKMIKMIATRK